MSNEKSFKFLTVSKDLKQLFDASDIKKIRLYNFLDGRIDLPISGGLGSSKKLVGTLDNVWIRVYNSSNQYYDFISSEIYFDMNQKGLVILASEDTEFISVEKISQMVANFVSDLKEKKFTNIQYIEKYASLMMKEIKIASNELQEIHIMAQHSGASRLDIEDSYEFGRNKLIKKYLLNLIASRIVKENKETILEYMAN